MEEIGLPELMPEQLEKLCQIGEKNARHYILSKISSKRVLDLNISVDIEGSKWITINVDVEISLSPLMKDYDTKKLAKEATQKAFVSIREYLSGIACKSKK